MWKHLQKIEKALEESTCTVSYARIIENTDYKEIYGRAHKKDFCAQLTFIPREFILEPDEDDVDWAHLLITHRPSSMTELQMDGDLDECIKAMKEFFQNIQ